MSQNQNLTQKAHVRVWLHKTKVWPSHARLTLQGLRPEEAVVRKEMAAYNYRHMLLASFPVPHTWE